MADGHRNHGEDGSEGGHQDGAHTGAAGHDEGLAFFHATDSQLIGIIDENDTIVYNSSHQNKEAKETDHGQLLAGKQQTEETTSERQGHGENDDKGRQKALELGNHDQVDQSEAE